MDMHYTKGNSDMKKAKLLVGMLITMLLSGCIVFSAGAEEMPAQVGGYITFGHYEQDNNLENGPEPIEWQVLDARDGRALVISLYGLDTRPIHNTDEPATWESCDLRTWLNGEFIKTAFTEAEIAAIVTVTVEAHEGIDSYMLGATEDINPGNDTQDQIFILSEREVRGDAGYNYFGGPNSRICKATEYAIAQGAWAYDGRYYEPTPQEIRSGEWDSGAGKCFWWLRSPGIVQGSFVCATYEGYLWISDHVNHTKEIFFGDPNYTGYITVRPAMWIELG